MVLAFSYTTYLSFLYPMIFIDYLWIALYLFLLLAIGIYFKKQATQHLSSYFLANRSLPWWALGVSGMAGHFDVSATMLISATIYVMGTQALYGDLRGDTFLLLAFLMVVTGKWSNRSKKMTTSEWMTFRFGDGQQGQWARHLFTIGQLSFTIWTLTYFIKGAGLFLSEIFQLESVIPTFLQMHFDWIVNLDGYGPLIAALFMVFFVLLYTHLSGFYGVVYTSLFQATLLLFTVLYVVILVMAGDFNLSANFTVSLPMGERQLSSYTQSIGQWLQLVPQNNLKYPGAFAMYSGLGWISLFLLFRMTMDGMSGSSGFVAQRFYAAKNEQEAGKMGALWIFLLGFRWMFATAIAILAIKLALENHLTIQPEQVLPMVLLREFPAGLKGFLVIGLLAAAMSTFAALLNAGAAYWANDVIKVLKNKQGQSPEDKTLVRHGQWAQLGIVIIALLLSQSLALHHLWSIFTLSLGFGLILPNLLRWYWHRMNGYGFVAGTLAGTITNLFFTLIQHINLFTQPFYNQVGEFILLILISLVVCILVSHWTTPTDEGVVKDFYQQTRPFGFWGLQKSQLSNTFQNQIRQEHRRDLVGIFLAVPWQISLCLGMIVFVTKQWHLFYPLLAVFGLLSVALYSLWLKHLKPE